ncbi:hypothetical protein F6455_07170 [Proteobacteria bacterium 005FR1]|nr:hypothetical protein [Proteobacteria bacterium 005FR1]
MNKEMLGLIAIALTVTGFLPYVTAILRSRIKPHALSWMIWGAVTFIVFTAQLQAGGGAGAWTNGVSGLLSLSIAVLAFSKSRNHKDAITRADWFFFTAAFSSLPLWYFTADPLWAVVILTTVDVLGFGPTIRKAYHRPHEEGTFFFVAFTARNAVALLALEQYSLATVLFPAATGIACAALVVLVGWRRQVVGAATR